MSCVFIHNNWIHFMVTLNFEYQTFMKGELFGVGVQWEIYQKVDFVPVLMSIWCFKTNLMVSSIGRMLHCALLLKKFCLFLLTLLDILNKHNVWWILNNVFMDITLCRGKTMVNFIKFSWGSTWILRLTIVVSEQS